MKIPKILKTTFKVLISLSIIVFLFTKINPTDFIAALKTFDIYFFLLLLPPYLLALIFGGAALKSLFREKSLEKGYYWTYIKAWFLGFITPGRVGEFSIMYFLRKKGISLSRIIMAYFLDKAISFSILFIIAAISLYFLIEDITLLKIELIIFILIITSLLLIINKNSRKIIRNFSKKFKIKRLDLILERFSDIIKNKKGIFNNFILNFSKWITAAFFMYIIFLGFDIHYPFLIIFAVTSIERIVSYLPISIGGLGVREITAVYLYGSQGIPSEIVLSVYAITYLTNIIVISGLFGLSLFIKKKNSKV
ncbi:MAG: lysylphosphatidylglycerol synthase transmembrane domain-containing protein [Nanoarchaeota archaeon]|nr:lysylphosphatidylglycerol synthase transmembrane domain-containing protein [Nanoarchaeota archaeon]